MKWFDKLERKLGRFAIRNLMWYIIAIYAVGFLVQTFWPDVYANYLSLDISMVMKGQVWRLITFIIQPPNSSLFWLLISLYFYYFIGTSLERAWGSFKFNVYYFSGIIFTVIAAFVIYFAFDGLVFPMSIYYINMALFLAFAVMYSDVQFLVLFIIPVKAKWLAYFDGGIILAQIVFGYAWQLLPDNIWYGLWSIGIVPHPVYATEALVSILNFIVFMVISRVRFKSKTQRNFHDAYKQAEKMQKQREKEARKKNSTFRTGGSAEYDSSDNAGAPKAGTASRGSFKTSVRSGPIHRCAVCGRTELDNPELEFRFCSKCYSNYEYCSEHLYTHRHVTAPDEKNG